MHANRIVTDFLLVATACTVILLQVDPSKSPRQTLVPVSPTSPGQMFSVSVADPAVERLRQQWQEYHHPTPSQTLSLARWNCELASYYAASTANETQDPASQTAASLVTDPTTVRQVSHLQQDQSEPATPAYWIEKKARAQQTVDRELQIQDQSRLASKPAFTLGPVLAPRHSTLSLLGCAGLGLFVGMFYLGWQHLAPALRCKSICVNRDQVNADPAWVRLKQPISVLVRQATLACLTMTALATLFC